MQNKSNTKNIFQEETNMKKYIVEAPEPTNDQKVSSGGIRNKNGKLASQFKNPIPYEEPTQPPAVINSANADMIRKEHAITRRNEVGMYLFSIVWQEFGEPLLRSGLRKLEQKIIDKLDAPNTSSIQQTYMRKPEIIEVEADEIDTIYDDKIIRFPNRKAI